MFNLRINRKSKLYLQSREDMLNESMHESPGKKVSGNKNLGKKSEFSQFLGKNVTGNKVLCFK